MKRLLTLLLFFNTMLLLLQAQPMHQIKGTVIDKNSRQPLEFINVMIIGLNKGSVTNVEGRFTIEQVPPGIYRLQASAIGYKNVTTSEYILSTKNLNIAPERGGGDCHSFEFGQVLLHFYRDVQDFGR